MGQKKYYYDPETCSFVEAEEQSASWLRRGAIMLGGALVLALLMVWALDAQWVSTPQEVALKAENEALQDQLSQATDRMSGFAEQLDALAEADRELYRTLLQAEPISNDVRQMGVGGTDPYQSFDQFDQRTSTLLRETAQTLDQLERQMSLQASSFQELKTMATQRRERLRQLPALRPADGTIVSGYGMRMHPTLGVRKMHAGVDILLEIGSPVVAPGDGVVKRTGRSSTYGRYVEVEHKAAGYTTRYAHLSEIPYRIRRGRTVARGDTIAFSGNSGRSTGPHLHYEVMDEKGRTINPIRFFAPDMTPSEYQKLLAKSERLNASID